MEKEKAQKRTSDSASHTQEADHIDTIKSIYNRAKNKAWVKNDDIKAAVGLFWPSYYLWFLIGFFFPLFDGVLEKKVKDF